MSWLNAPWVASETVETRLKEYGIPLSGAQKWIASAVGIDRPEEEGEGELAIHREQDLIPISVMRS